MTQRYHSWNFSLDFIRQMSVILWSSAIVSAVCLILVAKLGLNLGTDFAGGYEIQVKFDRAISETQVRNALSPLGLQDARVQRFGGENEYSYLILVRGSKQHTQSKQLPSQQQTALADTIEQALQQIDPSVNHQPLVSRTDFVGPQVGAQLRNRGILAVVNTLFWLLIYIALRFDVYFSPGAIVATVHDIIVVLGVFALFQVEFNLTVIGALLTLIGFSLNDTIVVYDRIRENLRRSPKSPLRPLVNRSINETLSRTILTSGTVLLVVTALLLLGGPYIFGFALTMFVGVIVGTYSSIAVASPVYILLCEYFNRVQPPAQSVAVPPRHVLNG